MSYYSSMIELIGKTPILNLKQYTKKAGLDAEIFAKLEYFNPAGSVKDRIALQMILDAENTGKLGDGSVIIEPTSGNTGIGLAAIGAAKGYRVILTMPETMSVERRKLLKAYGAELILTPGPKGMKGAIEKAKELAESMPNAFLAGQFDNPQNPKAHVLHTGPEIMEDMAGQIDIFVAGIGTGGTITGVGQYLKERIPHMQIIGVEPVKSPILTEGKSGPHGLMGIGAGFVPSVLNQEVYDSIMTVAEEDAYASARLLAKTEGVLVGITSGAALFVAGVLAKLPENKGKKIVVVLPDGGDRYLSTPLFEE